MSRQELDQVQTLGQTFTPSSISTFLCNWAIQSATDKVLDPTIGKGRFVFDSYNRLQELGASRSTASSAIHGAEIDSEIYTEFQKNVEQTPTDVSFTNIHQGDFFDLDLPTVDAVVGNPPYVMNDGRDIPSHPQIEVLNEQPKFHGKTDLYCYFVAAATEVLQPGGRLAMILSSSWLSTSYGESFKKFLLDKYAVNTIIGFRERVFPDEVNSVCLLATKQKDPAPTTSFVQVQSPDALNTEEFHDSLDCGDQIQSQQYNIIRQDGLDPEDRWDVYLRSPEIYARLQSHSKCQSLKNIATVNIGVQTLAKEFFVFDTQESNPDLPEHDLQPIVYTPSEQESIRIQEENCQYRILWVNAERPNIEDPRTLKYIENGENTAVTTQYGDEEFEGFHNKPRIKRANRDQWYNLVDASESARGQILLPRHIYTSYSGYWNPDELVANENFVSIDVNQNQFVKPLLAYLNSYLGELAVRLAGRVYGGGVCSIRIQSLKEMMVPDMAALSQNELSRLSDVFERFLKTNDRDALTQDVLAILNGDSLHFESVDESLETLLQESFSKNA